MLFIVQISELIRKHTRLVSGEGVMVPRWAQQVEGGWAGVKYRQSSIQHNVQWWWSIPYGRYVKYGVHCILDRNRTTMAELESYSNTSFITTETRGVFNLNYVI